MTKQIVLARGVSFPLDVVNQTVGILAKRRVGKSYTARRLAEQIYRAGVQLVIVDPKGDHWGIRSAADGKAPGLPIVIIGGEHGDIPLEVGSGEIVAKMIAEDRVSALLDLSLLRKHEVATFMALFLETLYRLKAREQFRTALFLILEEADAIAPQKPQANEARMLGAADDIVRRGGQRGIGVALVTQRSAVINKNVFTQCEVLIALRTISPQDRAALDDWIEVHGTPEQRDILMASLAALPKGDAWVWSPGWPTDAGIFKRVHVLPIETFDSGKSPEAGEKAVAPKQLADVDLAALTKQMAATVERAKQDDPKLLRKEIGELKAAIAKQQATIAQHDKRPTVFTPDRTMIAAAKKEQLDAAFERGRRAESKRWRQPLAAIRANVEHVLQVGRDMIAIGDSLGEAFKTASALAIADEPPNPDVVAARGGVGKLGKSYPTTAMARATMRDPNLVNVDAKYMGRGGNGAAAGDGEIGSGERRILAAIAQHDGRMTREHVTVVVGYKKTSRDVYIRRLKAAGYVDGDGDFITITLAGIAALGDAYETLPTGDALRTYWLARLPEGEAKILGVIADAYPKTIDRDTVGDAVGYKKTTRDVYLRRLQSRRLVIGDRAGVRAADELFG